MSGDLRALLASGFDPGQGRFGDCPVNKTAVNKTVNESHVNKEFTINIPEKNMASKAKTEKPERHQRNSPRGNTRNSQESTKIMNDSGKHFRHPSCNRLRESSAPGDPVYCNWSRGMNGSNGTTIICETDFRQLTNYYNNSNDYPSGGGKPTEASNKLLSDIEIDLYVSNLIKESDKKDNTLLITNQSFKRFESLLEKNKNLLITRSLIDDLLPNMNYKEGDKMIFLVRDSTRSHFMAAIYDGNKVLILDSQESEDESVYDKCKHFITKTIEIIAKKTIRFKLETVPQQEDNESCGLFVAAAINNYLNDNNYFIRFGAKTPEEMMQTIKNKTSQSVAILLHELHVLSTTTVDNYIKKCKEVADSLGKRSVAVCSLRLSELIQTDNEDSEELSELIDYDFEEPVLVIAHVGNHFLCILHNAQKNESSIISSSRLNHPIRTDQLAKLKEIHEKILEKYLRQNVSNINYLFEKVAVEKEDSASVFHMLANAKCILFEESFNKHSLNVTEQRNDVFHRLTGIKVWSNTNTVAAVRDDTAQILRNDILNTNKMLDTTAFDNAVMYLLNSSQRSTILIVRSVWTGEILMNLQGNDNVQMGSDQDILEHAFVNYLQGQNWEKIIFPIREGSHFWTIEYDSQTKIVRVFDSLSFKHINNSVIEKRVQSIVRKCVELTMRQPLQIWNKEIVQVIHQRDGVSCGLFALQFVDHILTGCPLINIDPVETRRQLVQILVEFDNDSNEWKHIHHELYVPTQKMNLFQSRRVNLTSVINSKKKIAPKAIQPITESLKEQGDTALTEILFVDENDSRIVFDNETRPYNTYDQCDEDLPNAKAVNILPTKLGANPLSQQVIDHCMTVIMDKSDSRDKNIIFRAATSTIFANAKRNKHQFKSLNATDYFTAFNGASIENKKIMDTVFIPVYFGNGNCKMLLAFCHNSFPEEVMLCSPYKLTTSDLASVKTTIRNILGIFQITFEKLIFVVETSQQTTRHKECSLHTLYYFYEIITNDKLSSVHVTTTNMRKTLTNIVFPEQSKTEDAVEIVEEKTIEKITTLNPHFESQSDLNDNELEPVNTSPSKIILKFDPSRVKAEIMEDDSEIIQDSVMAYPINNIENPIIIDETPEDSHENNQDHDERPWGSITITIHDYLTLNGTRWLNDKIIDAFMHIFEDPKMYLYMWNKNSQKTVLPIMSNLFHRKRTGRIMKDVKISAYTYATLPYCIQKHWKMCIYDVAENTAIIFDSLRDDNFTYRERKSILQLWNDLRDDEDKLGKPRLKFIVNPKGKTMYQSDAHSCGIYACWHAFYFLGEHELPEVFDADAKRESMMIIIQDSDSVNVVLENNKRADYKDLKARREQDYPQAKEWLNEQMTMSGIKIKSQNQQIFVAPKTPKKRNRPQSPVIVEEHDLADSFSQNVVLNTPVKKQRKTRKSSKDDETIANSFTIPITPRSSSRKSTDNEPKSKPMISSHLIPLNSSESSPAATHELVENEVDKTALRELIEMWKSANCVPSVIINESLKSLITLRNVSIAMTSYFDGRVKPTLKNFNEHFSILNKNADKILFPIVKNKRDQIAHCFFIGYVKSLNKCIIHEVIATTHSKEIDKALKKIRDTVDIIYPNENLSATMQQEPIKHNANQMEQAYSANSPYLLIQYAENFVKYPDTCQLMDITEYKKAIVDIFTKNYGTVPISREDEEMRSPSPQSRRASRAPSTTSNRSLRSTSVSIRKPFDENAPEQMRTTVDCRVKIRRNRNYRCRTLSQQSGELFYSDEESRTSRSRSISVISDSAAKTDKTTGPMISSDEKEKLIANLQSKDTILSIAQIDQLLSFLADSSTLTSKCSLINKNIKLKCEQAFKYFHNLVVPSKAEQLMFPVLKVNKKREIDLCIVFLLSMKTKKCSIRLTRKDTNNQSFEWIKSIIENAVNIIFTDFVGPITYDVVNLESNVETDFFMEQMLMIHHCELFANMSTNDASESLNFDTIQERLIRKIKTEYITADQTNHDMENNESCTFDQVTYVDSKRNLRKRKRESSVEYVSKNTPKDKDLLQFLLKYGYSPIRQLNANPIFEISLEEFRCFMEKSEPTPAMINLIVSEMVVRTNDSKYKVVNTDFISKFFENEDSSQIEKLREAGKIFLIPFQFLKSWYICIFDNDTMKPKMTIYFTSSCKTQIIEEKLSKLVDILKDSDLTLEKTYESKDAVKSRESKNSFISLVFNLHFILHSIHLFDKNEYSKSENKQRYVILNTLLNSTNIKINIPDEIAKFTMKSYDKPFFNGELSNELEDFNFRISEELLNAFICSIKSLHTVVLPLDAFFATGPLQGFPLDRTQRLIIPFKRETHYGLAIVQDQKCTIYDKEVNSNSNTLFKKIEKIASWYGRNRASCSIEKVYPSNLHPVTSLSFITGLIHSFVKHEKNVLYKFDDFSLKNLIKRERDSQPSVESSDSDWKYLDEVCRVPIDESVHLEHSYMNTIRINNRNANRAVNTRTRASIISQPGLYHIGNPLPQLFVLPSQIECKHCKAMVWKHYEKPTICCKNGDTYLGEQISRKITVKKLLELKEKVHDCSSSAPYRMLAEMNRGHAFAFRTTKALPRNKFPRGGTIPIKLNGAYKVAPVSIDLSPHSGNLFTCLNICNQSTAVERDYRSAKLSDSDRADVHYFSEEFRKLLIKTNPFYNFYKTAIELTKEELERAKRENVEPDEFFINIIDPYELKKDINAGKIAHHVKEVRGPIPSSPEDTANNDIGSDKADNESKSNKDKKVKDFKEALKTIGTSATHERNLNAPETDQPIAYFYRYEKGKKYDYSSLNKGIRVYLKKPNKTTIIPHMAPYRDSAMFPFVFPRGTTLYNRRMKRNPSKKNGKKSKNPRTTVSRREAYRYFMNREGGSNGMDHPVFGLGAINAELALHYFDQYENDIFCSIKKRAEEMSKKKIINRKHFDKFIEQKLDKLNYEMGVRIELPDDMPGSRKNLDKRFYSSMAIMRKFGKADLFLTYTGNPNWLEIEQVKLSKHEDWQYMSHDVARIFHAKLKSLMDDILKTEVLGKVKYAVSSIEFQKRGMPHMHMIIKLEEPLDTKEKIDRVVSAQIPEVYPVGHPKHEESKLLLELVKRHHVHGPCDGMDHMSCRKDWNYTLCRKKFPKPFSSETKIVEDDYPIYKRPDNGATIVYGSKNHSLPRIATNQHIVPYNPALLMKYQSHINIEAITGLMNFRYIFKYIYKGFDEILFNMKDPRDFVGKGVIIEEPKDPSKRPVVHLSEIASYLHARYIDQHEATWRLLGYLMSSSSHTVIPLFVHLEGENNIVIDENEDQNVVDNRLKFTRTKFLDYMRYMKKASPERKKLTFEEVNMELRHDKKDGYVEYADNGRARFVDKNVAYLVPVHPTNMEKYGLYVLARKRAGYTSYEELLTNPNNGTVYSGFEEAARGMGYLKDEEEWDACMQLGTRTNMAYASRVLFATILANCSVPNPRLFWEKFKAMLLDPDLHKQYTIEQREQKALAHIKKMLKCKGRKYKSYGLPEVIEDPNLLAKRDQKKKEESEKYCLENKNKLNSEQESLVEKLIACIKNPLDTNRMFLVTGSGGCGKTFLYTYLIHWCIANDHKIQPVASTGIASTLLPEGLTAHTAFKIPLDPSIFTKPNLNITKGRGKRLAETEVIIWDEISMTDIYTFDHVNRTLQAVSTVNNQNKPFGNKVILIGGDFKQILPILKNPFSSDVGAVTINNSELFNDFQHCKLTQNMRLKPDQKHYKKWIEGIGTSQNNIIPSKLDIPNDMLMPTVKDLMNFVFPDDVLKNPKSMSKCAILAVRNDTCNTINEEILEMLPGKLETLVAISAPPDEIDNTGMPAYSIEHLESNNIHDLPPHDLKVKEGCILMLMRNIDVQNKLCNGTKLKLHKIIKADKSPHILLHCENLSIDNERKKWCLIPRITLKYENKNGIALSRRQFPVKLCYAMTINKSQGQTLDRVGLCMNTPCFSHGQMYVAFSRVRCKDSIKVYAPQEQCQLELENGMKVTLVNNIVNTDLLQIVGEDLTSHLETPAVSQANSVIPYGVNDTVGGEDMDLDEDTVLSQKASQLSIQEKSQKNTQNEEHDEPIKSQSQSEEKFLSQTVLLSQIQSQMVLDQNDDEDDSIDENEMKQMINDLWSKPENEDKKHQDMKDDEPVAKRAKLGRTKQLSESSNEDNFENYENEDDQNRLDSDEDLSDDEYKIKRGTEYVNPEDSAAELSSDDDGENHQIHDNDSGSDFDENDDLDCDEDD